MEGNTCTIQVLADGKFVYDGYGYDSLDDLLSDLKTDLSGKESDDDKASELTDKKSKVKKIMEEKDEDY